MITDGKIDNGMELCLRGRIKENGPVMNYGDFRCNVVLVELITKSDAGESSCGEVNVKFMYEKADQVSQMPVGTVLVMDGRVSHRRGRGPYEGRVFLGLDMLNYSVESTPEEEKASTAPAPAPAAPPVNDLPF